MTGSNPASNQQERVLDLLLQHVTMETLNIQDEEGVTALHLASAYGNTKIARMLIAAG